MIPSPGRAVAAAVVLVSALGSGVSIARAADADATSIAVARDKAGVYVGGSAQFANDPRSAVAGRWSAARSSRFAKMDAATGTLQRSCGPAGVRLSSLGPSVLPGRAVARGDNIIVVGATLAQPARGAIAEVDGGDGP